MSKRAKKVQEIEGQSWNWRWHKTCIIGSSTQYNREKIASFDMDSTLIETKSGATFAKNADDWVFWHQSVPKKMKELYDDNYKIVIFTNQKGIATGKTQARDIQKKIETITKQMNIQVQAILATDDDEYRKPGTKMWDLFLDNNGESVVDMKSSFYCGDAAGRKATAGKKKDFSDSDLKFALNVGIEFKTPQNLFLGDKTTVQVEGFNPKAIPQDGKLFANSDDNNVEFVEKQMIIMCGSPGSGKSTFWSNYLSGYERVNRDTLKTKEKCYKKAQEFINAGKSVVIDNTNPEKADRKYFLDLARKHGYKARCFLLLSNKDICFHNDYQRIANDKRQHFSGKAGKIPIHTWWKKLEQPTTEQGFYEVKKVNFIAKFTDDDDKKAYECFSKK